MKSLVKLSVNKAITIIMVMVAAVVLGIVSLMNTKTELLPKMNLPYAVVVTTNVGASPDEIETGVTRVLEKSLATVSNIKNITSQSSEHTSVITLEFADGTNMDTAMVDMRESMDQTKNNLPDGASNPIIIKINPDMLPIFELSIAKEGINHDELVSWYTNEISPRLERIEGVASVSVSGLPENEIQVYLDDNKLDTIITQISQTPLAGLLSKENDSYFVSTNPSDPTAKTNLKTIISGLIAGNNISMPAGYVTIDGAQYLIRIGDKLSAESINDLSAIENLTILDLTSLGIPGVGALKVKDLAAVTPVNIADAVYSKVNKENAVTISMQKQSNYATTEVVSKIKSELKSITSADATVTYIVLSDQGASINSSVMNIVENALWGFGLSVIILFIFLRRVRITSAVALAIPLSIVVIFTLMYFTGMTLNMISMAGLALGVGMLVDNGIVVVENIYRLRRLGVSKKDAAIKGTMQVLGAITASTLTTICVFLPFIFAEGLVLQIFMDLALTVCFSLVASLIVSISIIPMITSRIKEENLEEVKRKQEEKIKKNGILVRVAKKADAIYEKVLRFALKYRSIILIGATVLFLGSTMLAVNQGAELMPSSDEGQFNITLDFEKGTSWNEATTMLDEVTEIVINYPDVETASGSYGSSSSMASMLMGGGGSDNQGTVGVMLKSNRKMSTSKMIKELNEKVTTYKANHPKIEEFDIASSSNMMSMGSSNEIQYQILGLEIDELETIATQLESNIRSNQTIMNAVKKIDNGIDKSKDEIKITVDKDKAAKYQMAVGSVLQVVAGQLQTEPTSTKVYLDGVETNIVVKDASSDKSYSSLEEIENIILPGGVLLKDVAEVSIGKGYSTIHRINQSKALTFTIALKDGEVASKLTSRISSEINKIDLKKGYFIDSAGSAVQLNQTVTSLLTILILALLLIYMVIAAQFQSFKNPFIIILTIPLAFTGGFLGLLITGNILSLTAMIGLLLLAGIIINNGIVLIEYISQMREVGLSIEEATVRACKTRIRPICMTALTTIGALFTMALGIGTNGGMMAPMAIVTIFGLIYGTLITLLLVPALYSLLNKGKKDALLKKDQQIDVSNNELDYLNKLTTTE